MAYTDIKSNYKILKFNSKFSDIYIKPIGYTTKQLLDSICQHLRTYLQENITFDIIESTINRLNLMIGRGYNLDYKTEGNILLEIASVFDDKSRINFVNIGADTGEVAYPLIIKGMDFTLIEANPFSFDILKRKFSSYTKAYNFNKELTHE
tara:strand:+ start:503 stop:955 length:453 start_codon:yes stop_codon:yes gene_type:complete